MTSVPPCAPRESPATLSPARSSAARRHEPWIDWLRAGASIAVVFFHLNEIRPDHGATLYGSIASRGRLGVAIFFVVSGYCVMLSSLDRPSALGFLFKRYVRVLPPYWASLLVVAGVVVARKVVSGYNDVTVLPRRLTEILATLTLTTTPVTAIPTVNWVYWTLSYELAFYGMMALALLRWAIFAPAMLTLTVATAVLAVYPLAKLPGLFFLDQWPLFALGVGLAETIHRRSGFGLAMMVAATIILPLIAPIAVVLAGGLTAASIYLVRAFPRAEARLYRRPVAFLGTISYSLYLIHVPIGVYALGHLVHLGSETAQPARLLTDALVIAGCILAAYAFHRAVERPTQRLAKSIHARRRARRAAAVSPFPRRDRAEPR